MAERVAIDLDTDVLSPHARGDSSTLIKRFLLTLLVVVAGFAIMQALMMSTLQALAMPWRLIADVALLLAVASGPVWFVLCAPMRREILGARESFEHEISTLHDRLRAHNLNVRLSAALEMGEDEEAALRIAGQALTLASEGAPAQLLLADSPDAPMRHDLGQGWTSEDGQCCVATPADCPVVRRGMGNVFEDSLVLSACRGMRGTMPANYAAACTPITVAGTGVGVVRALGTAGDPDLYRVLQSLNTVAHHLGARLATVRSISASAREAATDPLTGAANRRSGEALLAELSRQPGSFVLAMIDIDHFKNINDAHGHEVGDRVLKMFVDVITGCIRREDELCRYGGEEFLLILPRADLETAVTTLQRVRDALPAACGTAGVPVFTFSAGVSDSRDADPAMQMRSADAALYRAKQAGRDRVVLASDVAADGAQ